MENIYCRYTVKVQRKIATYRIKSGDNNDAFFSTFDGHLPAFQLQRYCQFNCSIVFSTYQSGSNLTLRDWRIEKKTLEKKSESVIRKKTSPLFSPFLFDAHFYAVLVLWGSPFACQDSARSQMAC